MSMTSISIFKGFVMHFDNGNAGAGVGLTVTTFSIGDPPVNFWSPFALDSPIAVGDYVAIAGKPSLVPGVGHVALAYRHLGASGSAHFFNTSLPVICILFGVLGSFGGMFLGPLNADTKSLAIGLLALGLFGIWRFWSMHTAMIERSAARRPY